MSQSPRTTRSCTTVQTRDKIHRPCLIYTAGSVFYTKILCILANAVFIGDEILCFLHRQGVYFTQLCTIVLHIAIESRRAMHTDIMQPFLSGEGQVRIRLTIAS